MCRRLRRPRRDEHPRDVVGVGHVLVHMKSSVAALHPPIPLRGPASAKARAYEVLINEVLKVQLGRVLDERDGVHERIVQCLELRTNMSTVLSQGMGSMKTMFNLGCEFYVQAHVPDTRWMYVDVGLGCRAQMTPTEAIAFSQAREARLAARADALTARATDLKARIKLVIGALDELMHIRTDHSSLNF